MRTLGSLQAALARLCSDEELRQCFFEDPVRVGTERLNLSPEQARECAGFVEKEVAWFAQSLLAKRRQECRKQLPLVGRVLGERFREMFAEYARTHPRPEVRVRCGDPLEFCRWLIKRPEADVPLSVREAARYEAVWLRLHQNVEGVCFRPRVYVLLLSENPLSWLEENAGADQRGEAGRGHTLVLWISRGEGRTFHRVWGLPW